MDYKLFKALGDKNRYEIIMLLINRSYCVRSLSRKLSISESAVSQHLSILKNAGMVHGEKRGYYTHYSVNKKFFIELSESLRKLASQKTSKSECKFNKTHTGKSN